MVRPAARHSYRTTNLNWSRRLWYDQLLSTSHKGSHELMGNCLLCTLYLNSYTSSADAGAKQHASKGAVPTPMQDVLVTNQTSFTTHTYKLHPRSVSFLIPWLLVNSHLYYSSCTYDAHTLLLYISEPHHDITWPSLLV